MNQQFFVGTKYMGQSDRGLEQVHGTLQPPNSVAYFCPQCGEVWARIVVTGQQFMVWTVSCEKHDPGWRSWIAGSMWQIWNRSLNESFPREVMKRELLLAINHWEKWNE